MAFEFLKRRRSFPVGPSTLGLNPLGTRTVALTDVTDIPGLLPYGTGWAAYSPWLVERVGVASRCIQLCAQQIASMPLRYKRAQGLDPDASPPAWVSNPDPANCPNGIADMVYVITADQYVYGDAFLYATSVYEDTGYPRTFTRLDPAYVTVDAAVDGGRAYRYAQTPLDPDAVLQISR